jgi:putative DNA primase/helicase
MTAAEKLSPAPDAPMRDFALDYARRGFAVFPCKPANKAPYTAAGLKDATTDELTVQRWWQQWPQAMIGVRMGASSGVWAIDPDAPKEPGGADGRKAWAELLHKHGAVHTHTHITPGGGQHLLFKWNPDKPVTNSGGALKGTGIDVRGEGGYIIAPPSRRADGKAYTIAEPLDFFAFADAPAWLYELIATKPEPFRASLKVHTSSMRHRAYAETALRGEAQAVRSAPKGERNKSLNIAGCKLGSLVAANELSEGEAIGALFDAAAAAGLVAEDGQRAVMATINSGLRKGMESPRVIPETREHRARDSRAVLSEAEEIDNGTITQDGIARVFARRYEDRLRFCHHAGAWYEWTGTHWQRDETALAFQFCRELAREFTEDAKVNELKEVRKVSFAGGVEKFARSDRLLAVTSESWDRDPLLLGTPGGTVDLRTGQLGEPDPADGITKVTAVAPADRANCPRWLQFLDETFGDTDLIRFLQQWGGYSLTGETREHALVFGFGNGKNGKSVWLNTHTGILKDYAATAAMDTFTASKSDRHPTDLAMLRGARLVSASETEEGRAWAESRIKQLTGGDQISARFMHKDFFTFRPSFKLTIIGNHKPILKNVDDAARRRFNLVPFNRTPAKPDPILEQKLQDEWPGILRWLIEGCLDWQRNGLVRPVSVVRATESYFEDQDLMSQWLAEACDAEPGNQYKWAATGLLFASWTDFATRSGEQPGSMKAFSAELSKRGFDRATEGHAKVRCFRGLMLRKRTAGDAD